MATAPRSSAAPLMAGTASGLESSSRGRSSGVDRSRAMTWNTTPATTVTVGSHRADPPARSGWGVQQHQREEDEPPDEARVTQGREEPPRRHVAFAEAAELGVVVAERAPGHRRPEPQERPSGRLVGRAAGHHHADQPAGDHGRDHQDVGEPGRRPDAVRAGEVRGERGHHQRRHQRPGDHPRQDAPRRPHVAIVAARAPRRTQGQP